MPFFKKRSGFSITKLFIIINTFVFIGWTFNLNHPSSSQFLEENFLVSWTNLTEGRYWTLFTSAFSHNLFWHFFLNMYVLGSFGPVVERTLGHANYIYFYLLAAATSSLSHSVVSMWLLQQPDLPALGASGAISGLILLFSLLYPKEKIFIFGIIPTPAVIGAMVFIGLDIWGLLAQAKGGGLPIGHGAHLGGAFTGILYYFFYIRPQRKIAFY